MTLPTFLIVGPQKCGTTALHEYLIQHVDIFMYNDGFRETHFFDSNYVDDIRKLEKYFSKAVCDVIGSQDPAYFHIPEVPNRIKSMIPDVKLIFIFRDPVKRAYSHYWANRRYCREKLSFKDAIEQEDNRVSNDNFTFAYKSIGEYDRIMKRWLKVFSKDQILVLFSEDLVKKKEETLRRVCEFIGVKYCEFKDIEGNKGGAPRCWVLGQVCRVCVYLKWYRLRTLFMGWNTMEGFPEMDVYVKKYLENYFGDWKDRLRL